MLRNIDFSNEVSIPNLYLCKPNCDTIASLSESFNIKFKLNYGNINELEFDIPTKIDRITTSGYELIDNPHIELLRYSYLIKFIYNDSTEYFVIDKSEEEINEDLDVKHIQCYSLAKEMENQLIINYEATSYNLQQVLEELFVELYEVSSASEALWTLNYIHPSFLNTYRQFKVAKKTLIEFILSDIKETFNCIPIFDTVNRQISFYRDEDYGANRGLIFDYGKYLKTINKSLETEEFCTVFKPFGNENLTISGVNPTGKNYLQDYSYFLYPYEEDELGNVVASSYYMSDSLCRSILDYNDLLEEKQGISDVAEDGTTITNIKMTSHGLVDGDWIVNRTRDNAYRKVIKIDDNNVIATSIADQASGDTIIKYSDGTFRKLLFEEEEFQTELTILETELVALQDELIILLDNVAICEETGGSFGGHDLTYWITQRDNKEIEIDSKKTSIDTKKAEIYSIKYEITVTNGATSDGDITFTIDGTDIVVAVNSGDSTSDVATKINTAFNELYDFNGLLYKSSVDSSVVTLYYYVVDDKADIITIFVDTDITGVTTSISDTNFGKSNLISKLQNDISMETNFTLVQRQELNQFKKVKEWEDSNYTDALDLYYDAKNKFVEINSPKIIFDIDIVNFLECIEEQINWEKLNLGDTVTIKYSIFNINETAKILNIEFDFEDRNVNLTIGNVTKIKNAKDKFLDELYKSIHTSNEVNIDKASWNTAINNFNSDNDSISSIPVSPTVANDGTAITHTVNTDGSVNIKFTWEFSGVEFFIDGFQIRVRSSSSSKSYTFGSTLAEENIIEVDSSKRSIGIEGVPADNYYTFGIRSFRKVRADITSSGVLYSDVVKSSYANDNPYLPSATVNYTGNINGTPASDFTDFLSVTYPDLQDQIDGKIMSWFQDSNPNTWTEADRLKHNGDMWYSSSTKLLKRYDGTTNSWTTIEDQKAIDAYTAASQAQDTADGKRRVFTTQPTPPYDVGDLWTGGSTGDLKRCKTAKESGSYSADDWELATKYTDDSALTNFVANTYTPGQNSLQAQIDGKIETYFQETDPNTWTEADRAKHNGDMWYSSSTKLLKRYNGILNSWELIEDQKAIDAYTAASQAQDTADGKRRVFTTQPTPPYDVGDLWTEGSTGDLKRCKTAKESGSYSADDWELATKYTDDSALTNFVDSIYTTDQSSLQAQIDGKIETYFQETDPNTWTEADRAKHNGDMWYSSSTKLLKRYNGILNSWELIEDQKAIDAYTAASTAQDTADGKRRVFTTQPTPPYDVGDLWTEGSTGDLKRCKTAKESGSYSADDWELATKYTDDSALTNFVDSIYTTDQSSLQAQIDGKIETYFQETDPNTWTEADRAKHNGDMWYSSSTKLLKRYNGILNSWELIEDQKAIDAYTAASTAQDTADGKRRVFTTQPTPPYDVGDLWTEGSTGDLKRCKTAKDSEGVYSASDWELATKYTDDSAANSKNATFSACPSDGKYKKNDIMIPSEGFVSGAKTFNAGEIYQALADGDGIVFNPVHWAEASLISLWKKTGTITIDGGQIAADSVNATQLNGDTAMVNFLNALNLTAKYISASGITAGTLTLTANLNIESSDGNLEINGTQLKYTHADGTESRLGASGLRLYENGQLLPYISTVDAGMIDKFNETEGYWNYIVGNNYKKYFYLKRRGIRWLNQADNVKMLVTQGEELEWYDPSQYRHTGIKGMKYAVGNITNVAPSVTIRINYVGSYYSTNTMVYLDSNASDINGFYAQEYITINGETRKIVQYIANSHRAFVDEAFSSPPQYNDMYLIHSGPGGVNIEVESWYLAPWYSGSSGGEYYYPLTFGYMLILNN